LDRPPSWITGRLITLLTLGPGSERIGGFFKNTDLFGHYLDFAGLSFRNPQEPLVAGACHAPTTEDIAGYLA